MNQHKTLPEIECTKSCHSHQHASTLIAAITKRAVSDADLASFLRCTCQNFLRITDQQGRSVIHMVASRGRRALLQWLICHCSTNPQGVTMLDLRDIESGYSAFHRSVFYGQIHIAIALMQSGINYSLLDNDDMSAIDLALLDRHPRFELSKKIPCEAYTWGANSNYTLGTGSQHHRNYPEPLTSFTKQGIFIVQVCLSKFHSVFVSSIGGVWSCGHGEGGRLGIATRDTRVIPTSVPLQEPCVRAAVGRDHTLFLLQSGNILSCGLNDYHQLGQVPPPRMQLSPRPVKLRLSSALGICAARYHSAAFNARGLYTWGLNGGQLGHAKDNDKTVLVPKKVSGIGNGQDCLVECVAVSDGATVATTSKGDIFVLYNYQCKRIAFRLHNIKSIQVVGGEVAGEDKLTDNQKVLSVLMLNTVGNIYLWQDTNNNFARCIFNTNRSIFVTEAALTREFIFITTKHGEAFQGIIVAKKTNINKTRANSPDEFSNSPQKGKHDGSKSFNQFIDKDDCFLIKLKRLPNIHRAVDICCDSKANNFAVLQVTPDSSLLDLPEVTAPQMSTDLLRLLDEASDYDLLHDTIIKLEHHRYLVHRYIICHGSEYFNKLCQEQTNGTEILTNGNSDKLVLKIENIHPLIFKQILIFLYTGCCDLMILGPCNIKIENNLNKLKKDVDIDVLSCDNVSAFEVNKQKKKEQHKSGEKNKENKSLCDPVRLLQAVAKRLSVTSLQNILDKYSWQNGSIVIKDRIRKNNDFKYGFDPNKLPELWDTHIKCSDGTIIKAHKCILASRLEYFNGMFCHTWAENTKYSTISLPINHKMLSPIINFLYTDECFELNDCEDFEFLGNMLMLCDQLLITRMREMCEMVLSTMLTLKNVPEILQISDMYNCPQLKNCCMEYISLNLSSLLETKGLETVEPRILEQLTEYYTSFNPIMCKRIITPFSESVSDEVIISLSKSVPTNLDEDIDDDFFIAKDPVLNSVKKKMRKRKTSHTEMEKNQKSEESNKNDVHLNLTKINENNNIEKVTNDWTKVEINTKQQKILQARLKAITAAKENSDIIETQSESFIKLTKNDSFSNDRHLSFSSPPLHSPTLSNYGSPQQNISDLNYASINDDSIFEYSRSPKTTLNITIVNTKLSQKQRKKLISESKENPASIDNIDGAKSSWNNSNNSQSPSVQPAKNPWNKIESIPTAKSNLEDDNKINFSEILEDQRKQKENLSKMMSKSLVLTQLEDRAMEELARFYYSKIEDDERITVKRIPCMQIAPPQWMNKSFK